MSLYSSVYKYSSVLSDPPLICDHGHLQMVPKLEASASMTESIVAHNFLEPIPLFYVTIYKWYRN